MGKFWCSEPWAIGNFQENNLSGAALTVSLLHTFKCEHTKVFKHLRNSAVVLQSICSGSTTISLGIMAENMVEKSRSAEFITES